MSRIGAPTYWPRNISLTGLWIIGILAMLVWFGAMNVIGIDAFARFGPVGETIIGFALFVFPGPILVGWIIHLLASQRSGDYG